MDGRVVGLLLAAGAGRRMGGPKALLRADDGHSWVERAVAVLHAGGCDTVRVVAGAAADEVRDLLEGSGTDLVVAADWADGMGASLRAGLTGLDQLAPEAVAALVHLVDLPDVGAEVLTRVAATASSDVLARAVYDGRPGHPVLLGRAHWQVVADTASGDAGARGYLAGRDVVEVECGDLASGQDVDRR